jgi:hypothetical protein
MSSQINTENIQITIAQLNSEFSGRKGSPDYDESKRIHIHRRNRAFVWNAQMQENCLDSILKGYYIPPIICGSQITQIVGSSRYVERREVMEGGNRITTFRRILNGNVRTLTDEERRIVEAHPITLVVISNLTSKQTREMFRRLNKNVRVSDGQLYSMSEEDSPLVREALALLNDEDYPLRTQITEYFFDTQNRDSDAKPNLENAVALVSGAIYGEECITRSFSRQEEHVENQAPIDRTAVVTILGLVFDVFRQANMIVNLTDGRKKKAQWPIGRYLGVILYDILMNRDSIPQVQSKWAIYLGKVRNDEPNANEAISVPGAQNMNTDKLNRMSRKVEEYITTGKILSKDELNVIIRQNQTNVESESDDEQDQGDCDEA